MSVRTTEANWVKHFVDSRSPQNVVWELERVLMLLFEPRVENDRLGYKANGNVVGCHYQFDLSFDATLLTKNAYTIRVHADWSHHTAEHDEYFLKTTASWFDFWTRSFRAGEEHSKVTGNKYRAIVDRSIQAYNSLQTIEEIQATILKKMRSGAMFSTAHKEGGTTIRFNGKKFTFADYGDYDSFESYDDPAEFLANLYKFFEWKTCTNVAPEKLPEIDSWKLILRLLQEQP